jgi:Flp pilus assembly protein TadG
MTAPLDSWFRRLRALVRDRGGNIAITFALAVLPVVALVGAGLDYGRALSARTAMQAVLDATALMMVKGSPLASMTQAQMQTAATNLFNAQFSSPYAQNAAVTPSFNSSSTTLTLSGSATVSTLFVGLVGINSMAVTASSQVTQSATSTEVVFVLDNTGSMVCGDSGYTTGQCTSGTPHITSLISAANQIVTTLFNTASLGNLKIAIVPYVTTANPGPKITQYVTMTDVNGNALYDPSGNTPTYDNTTGENTQEWKGCTVESKSMVSRGYDVSEPSGGWTGPWDAYYWPSAGTANNSSASTTNPAKGYSGIPDYNAWMSGNVGSRPSVNISYGHSGDLSTQCFAATQGPNNGCPTPITELTSNKTTISTAINALVPWCGSGTVIHSGMIWGWRAISPNPPFSDGAAYGAGTTKVVVLETDGENELVPDCDNPNFMMDCSNDALGANFPTGPAINPQTQLTGLGRVPDGNMGTTTSINTARTTLSSRLATVCANMKAAGIIIYTIGFGPAATGGADAATLQACAGPSPGQYFSAPNAAALQTAFQGVATSLGNLRIAR